MNLSIIFMIALFSLVISGCSTDYLINNTNKIDRTCITNEDCKQACPIGCININQTYEEPTDIACEEIICECINNTCSSYFGS